VMAEVATTTTTLSTRLPQLRPQLETATTLPRHLRLRPP
jgi:hypothetical protein